MNETLPARRSSHQKGECHTDTQTHPSIAVTEAGESGLGYARREDGREQREMPLPLCSVLP